MLQLENQIYLYINLYPFVLGMLKNNKNKTNKKTHKQMRKKNPTVLLLILNFNNPLQIMRTCITWMTFYNKTARPPMQSTSALFTVELHFWTTRLS